MSSLPLQSCGWGASYSLFFRGSTQTRLSVHSLTFTPDYYYMGLFRNLVQNVFLAKTQTLIRTTDIWAYISPNSEMYITFTFADFQITLLRITPLLHDKIQSVSKHRLAVQMPPGNLQGGQEANNAPLLLCFKFCCPETWRFTLFFKPTKMFKIHFDFLCAF